MALGGGRVRGRVGLFAGGRVLVVCAVRGHSSSLELRASTARHGPISLARLPIPAITTTLDKLRAACHLHRIVGTAHVLDGKHTRTNRDGDACRHISMTAAATEAQMELTAFFW